MLVLILAVVVLVLVLAVVVLVLILAVVALVLVLAVVMGPSNRILKTFEIQKWRYWI